MAVNWACNLGLGCITIGLLVYFLSLNFLAFDRLHVVKEIDCDGRLDDLPTHLALFIRASRCTPYSPNVLPPTNLQAPRPRE